jgi:hypothetical protein
VNAFGVIENGPSVQEAPEAASERVLLPKGIGTGASNTPVGDAAECPGTGVGEHADATGIILQFLGASRIGFRQVAVKRGAELSLFVVRLDALEAEEVRQKVDRPVFDKPVQGESAP